MDFESSRHIGFAWVDSMDVLFVNALSSVRRGPVSSLLAQLHQCTSFPDAVRVRVVPFSSSSVYTWRAVILRITQWKS